MGLLSCCYRMKTTNFGMSNITCQSRTTKYPSLSEYQISKYPISKYHKCAKQQLKTKKKHAQNQTSQYHTSQEDQIKYHKIKYHSVYRQEVARCGYLFIDYWLRLLLDQDNTLLYDTTVATVRYGGMSVNPRKVLQSATTIGYVPRRNKRATVTSYHTYHTSTLD